MADVMTANAETFAPRNGPALHVVDTGGQGLPVLFQHGLCGDAKQTAEMLPGCELFRRITLEARAHGQSEAGDPSEFSISQFASDCIELIEDRRLAPVVAAGISMGAAIALRIAVLRPELVRALVLARPAWVCASAPANMRPNAEVGQLLKQMPVAEAAFRASDTAQQLAIHAPDNLASLMGFFSRPDTATTAELLSRISADGPNVSPTQLRSIKVPCLVIGNRLDAVHPMEMAEELAGLIPNAKLVEITSKAKDRAQHVAEFQSELQTFLKGLRP